YISCSSELWATSLQYAFPTRHSSDLASGRRFLSVLRAAIHGGLELLLFPVRFRFRLGFLAGLFRCGIAAAGSGRAFFGGCCVRRSEEHTSELKSREKLVCRLLL